MSVEYLHNHPEMADPPDHQLPPPYSQLPGLHTLRRTPVLSYMPYVEPFAPHVGFQVARDNNLPVPAPVVSYQVNKPPTVYAHQPEISQTLLPMNTDRVY